MTKVEKIEQDIRKLDRKELLAFRGGFVSTILTSGIAKLKKMSGPANLTSSRKKPWLNIMRGRAKRFEALCFF